MPQMNMSEFVWVQLTQEGKGQLAEYYKEFNKLMPPSAGAVKEVTPDSRGWYEFQMHDLMRIFGQGCGRSPIKNQMLHFSKPL